MKSAERNYHAWKDIWRITKNSTTFKSFSYKARATDPREIRNIITREKHRLHPLLLNSHSALGTLRVKKKDLKKERPTHSAGESRTTASDANKTFCLAISLIASAIQCLPFFPRRKFGSPRVFHFLPLCRYRFKEKVRDQPGGGKNIFPLFLDMSPRETLHVESVYVEGQEISFKERS